MTDHDRSPCIIGVGRQTWRPGGEPTPEPLAMWEAVTRHAVADTGRPGALADIDAVHLVHCMSWAYDDPAGRLAQRLGIDAGHQQVSVLAGTAGQRMVNAAAERMLAGQSELALIVGGEALATRRVAADSGTPLGWSYPAMASELPPIDMDEWFWPTELAHDVIRPTLTFAALDTARRARLGIGPEDYRQGEAALLERFSAVAAANDHSWFPIRRSAAEIATVTPVNRIISSPYTKYMVAIMDVDMAAGLLVATHRKADELGIPLDRRIYLRGWSFGRDATHVAERPFLHRSPAMAAVARDALCHAGVSIDDVAHFDLYSCFASSVLFATDALGLHEKDSRGFTVAGGLPYHGGPSSNYTTHAIAAMVQRLREDGQGFGVVSGVGMHMTKHVWGVYGVEPGPVTPPDYAKVQSDIDRYPLRPVVTDGTVDSQGTIACYSVTHDRSGTPVSALVVADLPDGSRAYARSTDGDVLEELGQGERVGRGVRLRPGHGLVNELV